MIDKEQMRTAFEQWAKSKGYQLDELERSTIGLIDPRYFNLNTEMAWQSFQAASKFYAKGWESESAAPHQEEVRNAAITDEQRTTIKSIADLLESRICYNQTAPDEPPGYASQFDMELAQCSQELAAIAQQSGTPASPSVSSGGAK